MMRGNISDPYKESRVGSDDFAKFLNLDPYALKSFNLHQSPYMLMHPVQLHFLISYLSAKEMTQ
jgi:hypothetical protein